MKKIILIIGILLFCFTLSTLQAKTVKFLNKDLEILPLSEIKSGMIGYGESVFKGFGRERFEIEIESINFYYKNKYIIWIKVQGGPDNIINRAGIISGMSGSPIYLKDPRDNEWKLIGALAYNYPLQPPEEAQAGITPIEEMLNLEKSASYYYKRPANAKPADLEKLTIPLQFVGNEKMIKKFKAQLKQRATSIQEAVPPQTITYSQINSLQSSGSKKLEAGDAIAAVLSSGDLPLAAVGTVTVSNSNGFLAFGHPFLGTGISMTPVFGAEIGMIVPNIMSSFKQRKRITEPQLGIILVDDRAGVLGVWQNKNTMIPVKVNFEKYYPNGLRKQEKWEITIAKNSPYDSYLLSNSLIQPIVLGSPYLARLDYAISTTFTYREAGAWKKVSLSSKFFAEKAVELARYIGQLEDLYKLLIRGKKNIVAIEIDIGLRQKTSKTPALALANVEIEEKKVEPGKEIVLGIMLNDKQKNYSRTIKIQAPKFQGKVKITVQDNNTRLNSLIAKALKEPEKIDEVIEFINSSFGQKSVFVEIQHIKSITENKQTNNKQWQETLKKKNELINTEIRKLELPQGTEDFNLQISAVKTVEIKKETEDSKSKKK